MTEVAREFLVIRGQLDRAGRFKPRRCRSTPNVRSWPIVKESTVRVELINDSGQVLHSEPAEVAPYIDCRPGDAQNFRIAAYIEMRSDADLVQLVKGDLTLWAYKIPPRPSLKITLSSRDQKSKQVQLKLKYSDAGEGAFVTVVYKWGPTQFRTVYIGPPESTLSFERADLPGGERCLFAGTYSNGLRSAQDATDVFTMPRHGAVVSILQPTSKDEIAAGTPVIFRASVFDPERSGAIRGETDLYWQVDGDTVADGLIASVDGLGEGSHEVAAVYRSEPETRSVVRVRVRAAKLPHARDWRDWDPIDGDLTKP